MLSKQMERGIGGSDGRTPETIMDTVTMSPTVTWTQLVFRCRKHQQVYLVLPNDELVEINKYPRHQVEYRSQ
jgi:hypothetical protein